MTTFNIFLLITTLIAIAWGFYKGFMRQLGTLAGLILGILACRLYGENVAVWLAGIKGAESSSTGIVVLAYVLLFIAVYVAAQLVAHLMHKLISALMLGVIDRLAGAALCGIAWIFIVSLGLNLWALIAPESLPEGEMAHKITGIAPYLFGIASSKIAEIQNQ